MSIRFSMDVELWDEWFEEKFATIRFYDITIEMDMWLEDMTLNFNWREIQMRSASVISTKIPMDEFDNEEADQHVENYFNWSFDLILPWIQNQRVKNVNAFDIPKIIPGII